MSSKKSSDGLNQSVLKCLRGEGTKKDAKNAFRFFHDKAKSGQAQAQFEYGHALFTGFGVIPPFLMGLSLGIHAAVFSFMAGVIPPIAMLGRWLLYVQSHFAA